MKHQWGRSNDAGRTRSRAPLYSLMLLSLVLVAALGMAAYQYQELTTLQRWYLTSYLYSTYAPSLKLLPTRFRTAGTYQLVDLVDDRYIARSPAVYDHAEIEPFLRESVYGGQTVREFLLEFIWWPVVTAIVLLAAGLFVTVSLDWQRAQRLREGHVLRGGPRERTVAEFNRNHRQNNGLRIRVER